MNGVLVVNKPKGVTSRDVVNKVGKILGTKKIGHTGTLDPDACGVLVLCIGSYLKLVELLQKHDKEYIADVHLGIETDTLDLSGTVLRRDSDFSFQSEDIEKVLKKFVGDIRQEVPIYSSVKVNGRKLYEYARNGDNVKLPVRDVHIYDLKLVRISDKDKFTIYCRVSSGTYIRSLVRDIGVALGSCAAMGDLERISLGNFTVDDSYTIEDIEKGNYQLLSYLDVLDLPVVLVEDVLVKKISNGQVLPKFFDDDMVFICDYDHRLLAIYHQWKDGMVKPYRMF